MKKILYAIAILLAVGCSKAADTVVFGTIRTAEEDNPVAEAVAVKDGKFIYVGDKAGAEAKEFINNHDITSMPLEVAGGWDGHIMIADADNNVIVEFTGDQDSPVKYIETNIMTNFYNHLYEAAGDFPPHACGVERYEILKANYAGGNTMKGMWELMKKAQYTQAYKESTEPFWCSEHTDGIEGADISWTKEQILQEAETQKMLKAYKVYGQTGEYNPEDGMWFTAHNSVYDIANRALWVTVREKYENHYEFKL